MKTTYRQILIRTLTFVLLAIILAILVGCTQEIELRSEQSDIPLDLESFTLDANELDEVVRDVNKIVQDSLPTATYTGLIVFGDCTAFPKIDGKVTLTFMETEQYFFKGIHSYLATASVDIEKQKMDIRILANPYLNYEPEQYDAAEMSFVLDKVSAFVRQQNISNCTIMLTKHDDIWNAKCRPKNPDSTEKDICDFEIALKADL